MGIKEDILSGKTSIGIEFGSTRIKAVLIGTDNAPAATGVYDWQNKLSDGIWTYSAEAITTGLRGCFADLVSNTEKQYGVRPVTASAIGISAMMHGYLVFDKCEKLLVPFRTWRNTFTGEAADKLTKELGFNIPERWSAAHIYHAIMHNEPHVANIAFMTTLAGYVHFLLTGERGIGIGDASGMFPIDPKTGDYDTEKLACFDKLTEGTAFDKKILSVMPRIIKVGECAGRLTEAGALLLDPSGSFKAGVPLCPPEGDAQTGMVATNSIRPRTGNVSAGTSIFSMVVLEKPLSRVHKEIDIVTTPCGAPVAMVHCNSCTSDLDAWVKMLGGVLKAAGKEFSSSELYELIYDLASKGDKDCGGVISYNCYAGEPVAGIESGSPLMFRSPDSAFTAANLARSLVYSCVATLKVGMDILTAEEKVSLDRIYAHGGLFKTPEPSRSILAAALGTDVTLMSSAGEGGAWGIALLAAYSARTDRTLTLEDFLDKQVFAGAEGSTASPDQADIDGMNEYMSLYRAGLAAEKAAGSIHKD